MRAASVVVLGLLLLPQVALADNAKDWEDCASTDADRSLPGCNNIIARGKETKVNLAIAYFNRGNDYQSKGDHDKAIADYTKSIATNPDAGAYHNRGYSHAQKGEFDLAIADYDQTLKLNPDHKYANYDRGWAYSGKGDHKRALADYNLAIERVADDPDIYNDRGHSYAELDDLDHALADFEKAIALKADYALAHSNRAWVLARQEKHPDAITEYSEALRLLPDNADDLNSRGYSLIKTGEYDRAIADFTDAIALKPDHPYALHNRGWAYSLKGDLDRALSDFDLALQIAPADDLDLRTDRAAVLDDKGEHDLAIVEYDQVLAVKADSATALNGRGWAYAQKGDLDHALADSDRAVALDAKDPNYLHTRAWIYTRKGQLDLALADFETALGLDGELPGAYADRGYLYELKGDRDKALADYRTSLSLKSRQYYDDKAKAEALQRLTALAAGSPAPGGPAQLALPPPDKRIALVIGNAAYTNVRGLKNSDGDARAVAAGLRALGFEVIEKHDLTLPQLTSEMKAFGDKAPGYDWAVVYYAGHGIEIGGINYLIPVDAELSVASHVDDEALPLDRVLAKVEGAHKLRLVILDACRDNPFIAKMASAGGTRSVGRGLARVEPSGGVLVAYSARDGQVAQDGDGTNSPFAQALIDHLAEPGLEINMLFRKVRDDVKSRTNGQQEPFTYGSLPAEAMYFKGAGQ
jgi:tetratricopeptide (TPR) repeat protein